MIRTHRPARAWSELEIDDDGELVQDVRPARCPTCLHTTDLGGIDDIDVHRCGFCRTRTRFLWSDRRGMAVPDLRVPRADWDDLPEELLWDDFDPDDEREIDDVESNCANGCEDPVFGGPVEPVLEHGRWVCPLCGAADEGEF